MTSRTLLVSVALTLAACSGEPELPVLEPTGWTPPEAGWRVSLRPGPSHPAPDWRAHDRTVPLEDLEVRRGEASPAGAPEGGLHLRGPVVRVALPGPLDLTHTMHARLGVSGVSAPSLEVRVEVAQGERRLAKPWEEADLAPAEETGHAGEIALKLTREQRLADAGELVVSIRGAEQGLVLSSVELTASLPDGWRALLEEPRSEPARIAVATESRRGWVLAGGQSLAGSIEPPQGGAILLFGIAYPPEWTFGEATGLRLELRSPGGDLLGALDLPPEKTGSWQPVRVDLPPGVPGRIELTVALQADSPAAAAVEVPALFAPKATAPTVVLISSDTHRGDHLGVALHSAGALTPALDALAARGLEFADAQSTTNITVPSHAALFTGLSPRDTGVIENMATLSERASTLAQAFSDAGYLTLGVASSHLLRSLDAGFDRFDGPATRRVGEATLAVLDRWLPEASGRPLFLFVHLYDAHGVYQPPERFERMYWPADRDAFDPSLEPPAEGRIPPGLEGLRDLDYLRALYKGEISHVDDLVGRLLARPRMASAVVAFTADHGECLGQHGIWWAHKGVYQDTLHVPLLLSWPHGPTGFVWPEPVSHLGLGRTLLDLAGLADVAFPGTSLLDELTPEPDPRRPLFALAGSRQAASVRRGRWQLVRELRGAAAGRVELFDLEDDPAGLRDVAGAHPDVTSELGARLERWLAEEPEETLLGGYRSDPATLRMLAELGYLTASSWSGVEPPDAGQEGD